MKGDLADLGVADLLYLLALRGQTGRLTVSTPPVLAHLYLVKGQLVLVTTTDPTLRIGEYLVQAGVLTDAQLAEALEEQRRAARARALGVILVDRGWVTPADVAGALRAQTLDVLVRLLGEVRGRFTFKRDVAVPRRLTGREIDTDRLLLEAARLADVADDDPLAPRSATRLLAGPRLTLPPPAAIRGGARTAPPVDHIPLDEPPRSLVDNPSSPAAGSQRRRRVPAASSG
jgi:hypothetical protein